MALSKFLAAHARIEEPSKKAHRTELQVPQALVLRIAEKIVISQLQRKFLLRERYVRRLPRKNRNGKKSKRSLLRLFWDNGHMTCLCRMFTTFYVANKLRFNLPYLQQCNVIPQYISSIKREAIALPFIECTDDKAWKNKQIRFKFEPIEHVCALFNFDAELVHVVAGVVYSIQCFRRCGYRRKRKYLLMLSLFQHILGFFQSLHLGDSGEDILFANLGHDWHDSPKKVRVNIRKVLQRNLGLLIVDWFRHLKTTMQVVARQNLFFNKSLDCLVLSYVGIDLASIM